MNAITLTEYDSFLESWRGVPYKDCGFSRKGVDCLRFVIAVLDWLHGWESSKLPIPPLLPRQTSLHAPRTAFGVIRFVQMRYPHRKVWDRKMPPEELSILPGDCIVVRNQIYPGHGLVAGAQPGVCWHSLNDPTLSGGGNVHPTNLFWCMQTGIVEVFRPTESLLVLPEAA